MRALPKVIAKHDPRGENFDVLLAHSSRDKSSVHQIALALKRRRIRPWFDEWHLPPGRSFLVEIEKVLPAIRAVAVIVGPSGVGPWESLEMRLAITRFVQDGLPVIPVLLPDAGP